MRTAATGSRVLTESDFAVPLDDRYFEDYQAGAVEQCLKPVDDRGGVVPSR